MAGPATVVVAGFFTWFLAARTENALVVDNYYKEGLAINQVLARDAAAAKQLAERYQEVTSTLVKMLERDHMTPSAGDLTGVLVAGQFQAKEAYVLGTWPISKAFVESLASSVDLGGGKQ